MLNKNKNATKKWIYHFNIAIFWADNRKSEEKAMLLQADGTPASGVEVLELEPKHPFGFPLEADFSDGPPPQLFYEVVSFQQGSPTEVLISAESIALPRIWNNPETQCDFVGELVDAVGPGKVVTMVTDLVKRKPTYSGEDDSDCQTFALLLMADLLSSNYVSASNLDHYLNTATGLDNTVERAINNARGRPAVVTALVTARQELYHKLSEWAMQHLQASEWSQPDFERLDKLCTGNRFANAQWSSNERLNKAWEEVAGTSDGYMAKDAKDGVPRVDDQDAFATNILCYLRREKSYTTWQKTLDEYRNRSRGEGHLQIVDLLRSAASEIK